MNSPQSRVFCVFVLATCAVRAEPESVDFARQVLPILSDKCFVCHGPDGRDTDLRLDSFEAATADLGGYRAIDSEKPEQSEILARIHDSEDPMPPKKAEKKLTTAEREILSRWVREGGKYTKHWAYVAPEREANATIDSLVRANFPAGVDFAPPAPPSTLARRAALVLTGLPPEPEQLQRFLADRTDGAYERLIDELLASPRYGEHQARYWLDAVRYGDTHGLHLDNRRGIYPYRDWVVKALNENLPLDTFLTWQLAGDLLPQPTLGQLVATGFVRMNPTTAEGGAIAAEFQAKNNFDRVETLGTALLGASLVCARCHTHKYDPIPQTEYYRLMAFFNSTSEGPLDGNAYIYGPAVKAPPNLDAWKNWEALTAKRAELLQQADLAKLDAARTHAVATLGWKTRDWRLSKPVSANADAPPPTPWAEVKGYPGSRDRLPKPDQARWVSFALETPVAQTLVLRFASGDGFRAFVDGAEMKNAQRQLLLGLEAGLHEIRLKLVGSYDRLPIEILVENPWKTLAEAKSWEACSESHRLLMLADPAVSLLGPGSRKIAENLARAQVAAESEFTTTLVARDLANPRPTRMLSRGEYHLPAGDPLEPGVLSVMGEMPAGAPKNRLGLAAWLTSSEHPLVTRVLVNRLWQQVFGDGLVRTPEDFGLQGEQPTHPELLDWLAVDLRESGWDLKRMLRLLVTSRAFRQDSRWRPELKDPENRFFARGPGFRLDAEVLRDTALWASGLLDPQMGGEGVKPWQPPGMWKALMHPASNTKSYVPDNDAKAYRRSLYVYWKRTSPHPMMTLFDAPNRESSCVRRSRSNTPLQSLGLLNEAQRIEMSRALARRLIRDGGQSDDSRLNLLFTLLASREPTAEERAVCRNLLETMRKRYSAAETDAAALLSSEAAPEAAAWTQVANTMLASDLAILLF